MKRAPLNALIQRLKDEVDDAHFTMRYWLWRNDLNVAGEYYSEEDIPYCKTAGCMAGQVFLSLTPEKRQEYLKQNSGSDHDLYVTAAETELGLSKKEASLLFAPSGLDLRYVTRQHAIAVLEGIRDNQMIDWKAAAPDREWLSSFNPDGRLSIELTD